MARFAANPLSLSIPEPAFETWLRDSGYLDLLDHRTSQLHHLSTTSPPTVSPPSTTAPPPPFSTPSTTITSLLYPLFMSFISSFATLLSLFTLNPFSKLTSSDFSGLTMNTITWTDDGFLGNFDSYSFPSSPSQAKMRVHENVKRFCLNYSLLSLLFFACSLYQMPLALIGLLSCLAVWELCRFCDARWALERFPSSRQVLIRVGQCAVATILFWCNVQAAVFWTVAVSYAVLIMHASFRKLTPAKQSSKGRGR